MSRRVSPNAEPGTGTQYYIEACVNPNANPRLHDEICQHESTLEREKAELAKTQYRLHGRTWQCGGEYWDRVLDDLVELEAVVRKSSWCDTREAENGTLKFQFVSDHYDEVEVDPAVLEQDEDRMGMKERFLPRHNVPFKLP